jgi:hypothetical protein
VGTVDLICCLLKSAAFHYGIKVLQRLDAESNHY